MAELWQQKALAIMPKCTSSLSMMGSAFVLQDISKDPVKRSRTYGRILLGISSFDMIISFGFFLSTWPIPGPPDAFPLYSSGNQATCEAQGFILQLSVAQPIYSLGLCMYYLCVMVYRMPDKTIQQRLERPLHFVACSIGFGTAIAGLPLKLYNNATLWCWIASVPTTCVDGLTKGGAGPDPPQCERGKYSYIFRWAFYYGIVFFCFFFIAICMATVTYFVHSVEKASRKYRQPNPSSQQAGVGEASSSMAADPTVGGESSSRISWSTAIRKRNSSASNNNKARVKKADKIRQLSSKVFWQSFHYVLVFYITWIFAVTLRTMQTIGKPVPIQVILCMAFFIPLQGFFTFTVYIRPRVLQYREKYPDANLFFVYYYAMTATKKLLFLKHKKDNTTSTTATTTTQTKTGQELLLRTSQMPVVSELEGIKSSSIVDYEPTRGGAGAAAAAAGTTQDPALGGAEDHVKEGGEGDAALCADGNNIDNRTTVTDTTGLTSASSENLDANIMDPAYALVATLRSSARLYQRQRRQQQDPNNATDENANDHNNEHDIAFERFLKEFGEEELQEDDTTDHHHHYGIVGNDPTALVVVEEGDTSNNKRTGRRTFGQSLRQSLQKLQGSLTSSSVPPAIAQEVPSTGVQQEESDLPLEDEKESSQREEEELNSQASPKETDFTT